MAAARVDAAGDTEPNGMRATPASSFDGAARNDARARRRTSPRRRLCLLGEYWMAAVDLARVGGK
jgi:hypothetical protein